MGMYTQVRGWLNIDSIAYDNKDLLEKRLSDAKESFIRTTTCTRKWVCEDTILHIGGNGSAYLFLGTELKNYDDDAETWIKHLITFFDNAEGRIDFQYEESEAECEYWLISKGEIIKEGLNAVWCEGYGNCSDLTHKR